MLRWAFKVSLATNGAIVLSRRLLQVNAQPSSLCNVDRAHIFDDTRSVGIRLNLLANSKLGHCVVAAAGRSGVLTRQLRAVLWTATGRRVLEDTELPSTD